MKIVSAIMGVWYIVALVLCTITIVPALYLVLIARMYESSWKDALYAIYVEVPINYLTGKIY